MKKPERGAVSTTFRNSFAGHMRDARSFWASMSEEEQIMAAMIVFHKLEKHARRLGTYRVMLYNLFRWSSAAYAPIQLAGGLTIHNLIAGELAGKEENGEQIPSR
jgi:hypothetical protein